MLLNNHKAQDCSTTKNYLVPSVNSAKVQQSCSQNLSINDFNGLGSGQVVDCLPSKGAALSSNASTGKTKEKRRKRKISFNNTNLLDIL
jgi:hypothetical protein